MTLTVLVVFKLWKPGVPSPHQMNTCCHGYHPQR